MRIFNLVFLILAIGGILSPAARLDAASEERKTTSVRTVKGIQFNLPEDWPIKEQGEGSALQPIPVEEYVVLKFGKVDERLEQLDKRMTKEFTQLKSKVKELSDKVSDLEERLRDLERWLKHGEARHL